jgi:hypothetical protein
MPRAIVIRVRGRSAIVVIILAGYAVIICISKLMNNASNRNNTNVFIFTNSIVVDN